MKRSSLRWPVWAGLAAALCARPGASADDWARFGQTWQIVLSEDHGGIRRIAAAASEGTIFRSGEHGLWRARFGDGTEAHAAGRTFARQRRKDGTLLLRWGGEDLMVAVTVRPRADGVAMEAEVTPHRGVLLELALPARLRMAPSEVIRFVCPANGNQSVGTAFRGSFFARQPAERAAAWGPVAAGPKGYISLFGGPLQQRANADPPVPLRVTEAGRQWLGDDAARRLSGAKAVVNRPPAEGQSDLVLADSPNGAWLSASGLGGEGRLWRLGGSIERAEVPLALHAVPAVVRRLAAAPPAGRNKLGLVALRRGPPRGGWTFVAVEQWRERLRRLAAAIGGVRLVELTTPAEMLAAARGGEFLAILNPYGEWLPVAPEGELAAAVAAVGRYVRAGGNWFEVGGYPFYYALRPVAYYRYGTDYPAGFADFFGFETRAGRASVFRAAPRTGAPWSAAGEANAAFVPGRLACGGDEAGGWCERPFCTYVPAGCTWRSPEVRIRIGHAAADDLREYCRANGIRRRLAEKMPADVLGRFRRAVLVKYDGPCQELHAHLGRLPAGSLLHFSDYLKGGFDKEYPDHLPPSAGFGTGEALRAFCDEARRRGHLLMPYTNPTWWCDEPRGPTFRAAGEAPLLRKLDGTLSPERYGRNTGFTICHWHAAVREANARTVRQFTKQYPVDVLFQDQCGARGWRYDTNPACPAPYAYVEGLLSMVQEDCRAVPLSTESGWDRVVEYESQLCGLSWAIVPTEGGPAWRTLMKHEIDPGVWEIFPLAQHIAHDKTAMLYHDLGQFVTNRQVVAWTLGLGFCMSYRTRAAGLADEGRRQWLLWLDRLQKSVCARYVGEPVRSFAHERDANAPIDDDGVLRAAYGPVTVVANLSARGRVVAGRALTGFGFHAAAANVQAGCLGRLGGADFGEAGAAFVAERRGRAVDVWIYGAAGARAGALLPGVAWRRATVAFDGAQAEAADVREGGVCFRLPGPGRPGGPPAGGAGLWHATVTAP